MSGHSHWATIKHKKGAIDAKRGKLFSKLSRAIIIAAKHGGGDPEMNLKLRYAIDKAREVSMPKDNIDRAIKRGSGELEGVTWSEMTMEGYGPSGVAILVKALSDNRNRTLQDVRNIFLRNGGSMVESGAVAWQFEHMGLITIDTNSSDVEELELKAIDAGAEDVKPGDGYVEIYTTPTELEKVKDALENQQVATASAELSWVPKNLVELDEKAALQTLRLLDRLEDLEEVQVVASNADFSDAVLEKYRAAA